MRLIALPGRNPETASWMQTVATDLLPGQDDLCLVRYRHWDEACEPDAAHEAERLELAPDDGVIAKSMGTLVLLARTATGCVPGWAVLIGTPLDHYDDQNLAALLALVETTPVLFVQQTGDFTRPFPALRDAVGERPRASLV